jgi:hypothetical protein
MSLLRLGIAPILVLLAGCGTSVGSGKLSGKLQDVVAEDTSPYALLELATGNITWYVDLPDGDPNLLKTTHMAFRRVAVGGNDALVGIFEVTQEQWERLYGAPPATWPWEDVPDGICNSATAHGPNRPAYNLEYEMVADVLDAYAPAGQGRLALPTDAQWLAACGVANGWWWGTGVNQTLLTDNAVVRESILTPARIVPGSFGVDTAGPLDVGSRDPSSNGFFDLHGNVWELIAGGDHAKGGSWRDSAWQSRAEASLGGAQGYHGQLDYALVGMRLVLVP